MFSRQQLYREITADILAAAGQHLPEELKGSFLPMCMRPGSLYEYIKNNGMVRLNQVVLLRAQMKTGAITQAQMISMLNNSQPGKGPATKLTFSEKKLREFFPAHYTSTQMRDVIEDLLSDWKHKQDFEGLNGE